MYKVEVGSTFNNLTVLHVIKRGCLCVCACGVHKFVTRANLVTGRVKSCGCLIGGVTHGKTGTPTFTSWKNMLTTLKYIDPEWLDFSNFLRDMGEKPVGLRLNRLDKEEGFFKDNCEWGPTLVVDTPRKVLYQDVGDEVDVEAKLRKLLSNMSKRY